MHPEQCNPYQNQTFHLHGFSMSGKKNLFNLYGKSHGDIFPLRVQKPLWSDLSLS